MAKAQQVVYGLLAVLGVVLPWRYNLEWMQTAASTSPVAFFEATMVNPAASSISVDIGIVFVAFSVFVILEGRRLGMRFA